MKSSKLVAIAIAIFALLWILSGVFFPASQKQLESQAAVDQDRPSKIMEVRVREITAEAFADDVVVTGRTRASRTVEIKAETDGQISEIIKEKGEQGLKQEVIARLELRDRKARLRETKQRLNQRQIEYNAAKKLQDKGFNSKVKLAQSRANLETARAELKNAEVDLAKTKITLPFDGVINGQSIELGDFVSVGDPLFSVVDLDPIELVAFVSERNISEITQGQKSSAKFVGGRTVEGVVSYVAPAADPETRTFQVEISVSNIDFSIKEGLTAKIKIPVKAKQAHKISPSILSLNDAGQIGVKIVGQGNKVAFVPVSILSDTPEYMWVYGLPDKVVLITVGQEFVVQGQVVKPVQADGDGLL